MNLLSCPFCDAEPFMQPHGAPGLERWQVICPQCHAAGPVMTKQSLASFCWNGMECVDLYRAVAMSGHARPGVSDMKDED